VLSENDAKTANMPGGIYKNLYTVRSNREKEGYACDKMYNTLNLSHIISVLQYSYCARSELGRGDT
jgi:hypothetical protein